MLIREFFQDKVLNVPKEVVLEQMKTIIKEPVMLNATDAALILGLVGRKLIDRCGYEWETIKDVLINGSKEFRS